MHEPERIEPKRLGDYLETMSKSVLQAGISWKVVDAKWPGIRDAFRGFDAETVANLGEADLDELTGDTRVIRNRRKLEAIVHNARTMLDLEEKYGGFRDYLRSHEDFYAAAADIRKQFKFLGDMGCYHFMWVVGEDVPPYEEWRATLEAKAAAKGGSRRKARA